MVWNNNEQDGSEGRVREKTNPARLWLWSGTREKDEWEGGKKSSVKPAANNGHKKLQMLEININAITEVNCDSCQQTDSFSREVKGGKNLEIRLNF